MRRYAKRARPKAEGRRTVPRAIDNGDNDGAADREALGSSSDDDEEEDENSGGSLLKQAPTAGTYDGGLDALDAPQGNYSDATLRSLACVDPSLLHYELIEALLAHVLASQAAHGPAALLQARCKLHDPGSHMTNTWQQQLHRHTVENTERGAQWRLAVAHTCQLLNPAALTQPLLLQHLLIH